MLRDKIKQDVMVAMKARDQKRVDVLRYLVSLIDKKELQLPLGQLDEGAVLVVLQKELKNKEESKAVFVQAGRAELAAEVDYEMGVLQEYLPTKVSDEEVEKVVVVAMAKVGGSFPMVMKEVMGRLRGRAEGEVVTRIVKERLANG